MSGKIIGLGGIFLKSNDKKRLSTWYQDTFDMQLEEWGTMFPISSIESDGNQVFSIFPSDTKYFPTTQSYMINWMVDDMDKLVEKLIAKGVEILVRDDNDFGKFTWINDIDGNKLELWQPPISPNNE